MVERNKKVSREKAESVCKEIERMLANKERDFSLGTDEKNRSLSGIFIQESCGIRANESGTDPPDGRAVYSCSKNHFG